MVQHIGCHFDHIVKFVEKLSYAVGMEHAKEIAMTGAMRSCTDFRHANFTKEWFS